VTDLRRQGAAVKLAEAAADLPDALCRNLYGDAAPLEHSRVPGRPPSPTSA
jgi:hypothetical protein